MPPYARKKKNTLAAAAGRARVFPTGDPALVRPLPEGAAERDRQASFFFNHTATTEIYTLSLHDALPICCASSSPRCAPTPTSTASSCYAPATRASPPPTSPRAIRASTKPNEAGGTSSPPSTCAPSTTAARTASAPTCSCTGSPCCCCGSPRPPWATPGATSATNSNGCTWSPSPLATATSPSAASSPPASARSCGRSSYPSRPASSTSPPPTSSHPAHQPRSNTTPQPQRAQNPSSTAISGHPVCPHSAEVRSPDAPVRLPDREESELGSIRLVAPEVAQVRRAVVE